MSEQESLIMAMPDIAHQRLYHQRISHPTCKTPGEAVAWLGALQGQDFLGAKWSVVPRVPSSNEADIELATADTVIVRTWAMRGTLHLMTAADIRWILALVAPRHIASFARRYRQLELDEATLVRSNDLLAKV